MSDKFVIKANGMYVECVTWGSALGLNCYHTHDRSLALRLSYSEADDLINLICMHQVPDDFTFQYKAVKLVKKVVKK
jgi:hypothetical protein